MNKYRLYYPRSSNHEGIFWMGIIQLPNITGYYYSKPLRIPKEPQIKNSFAITELTLSGFDSLRIRLKELDKEI